jgi:hypothetical protein
LRHALAGVADNSRVLASDTDPLAGTYMCVNCFYMDAPASSVSLVGGLGFLRLLDL